MSFRWGFRRSRVPTSHHRPILARMPALLGLLGNKIHYIEKKGALYARFLGSLS